MNARGRGRISPWLLLGTLAASVLAALPLAFLLVRASQAGWDKLWTLISTPHVMGLLQNTLVLAVTVVAASAVIGVFAAWCVERTDLPGRRFWSVLLVLPMAVPDFVSGYGWVSLFPAVHGFGGAALVMTLSLYPLIFVPVAASLRQSDPLLAEVARGLGLGPWRTFWRVVLPEIRPALAGGCVLVVLAILAEYGAFEILRFQTFTTAIFTEFTLGFDTPGACAESLVLVFFGLLVLTGERTGPGRIRGGSGSRRPPTRWSLGHGRAAVLAAFAGVLAVALGVPLFSLGWWLSQGNSSTLPRTSLWSAMAATAVYAAAAAALAATLAVALAAFSLKYRNFWGRSAERLAYLPQAIPGVVVGLALVFFALHAAAPFYQSPVLLVIAYANLFLPLALVPVRAVLSQTSSSVQEAARSLGASPVSVFWRVRLPLLVPGLAAAFALVFLSASTELTATLLLRPTGLETLSTQFWRYVSAVSYGAAAPDAVLLVLLSLGPGILLAVRSGRTTGAVRR